MPYLLLLLFPCVLFSQSPVRNRLPDFDFENLSPAWQNTNTLFNAKINNIHQWMNITGHPQSYNLYVGGRPTQALGIDGHASQSSSGFSRNLCADLKVSTALNLSRTWELQAGILGGFDQNYYRLTDNVISEHPDYGFVGNFRQNSWYIGFGLGACYRDRFETYTLHFGSSAYLDTRSRSYRINSYVGYTSERNPFTKLSFTPFLSYSYISKGVISPHQFEISASLDYNNRLVGKVMYRVTSTIQTPLIGFDVYIYRGLYVGYLFLCPFAVKGSLLPGTAHAVTLGYKFNKN